MGGSGPIPWLAVDAYAKRNGIEGQEFDAFWLIIQTMDAAYLEESSIVSEERAKNAKPEQPR